MYRVIDFKRDKTGIAGKVTSIEYDPNRNCRIALINYADGEKRYIIVPEGLAVGATITSGPDSEINVGNTLPLKNMPLGTFVHNVELVAGRGGQIARSAGNACQVMAKEGDYATFKMPSGETRKLRLGALQRSVIVGNGDY